MLRDRGKVFAVAFGSTGQIGLYAAASLTTTFLLPAGDRGRYVLLMTVIAVTAPLAGIGTNVGLRRQRPTSAMPGLLESIYTKFSLKCALGHGLVIGPLLYVVTGGLAPLTLVEVIAVGLVGVTQVLNWQFVELWFARLNFRTGAIYSALNSLTMLVAAIWALVDPHFVSVVLAQGLASLALHVGQLFHITKTAETSAGTTLSESNGSMIWRLARSGAPSIVMTAGLALAFRLDRLLLGFLAGAKPVAVYAMAASFAELPRFIPAAFGQLANGHAAQQRGRLGLRTYLLPSAVLGVVAAVGAGLIGFIAIGHLGSDYRSSKLPLVVLLVAEILLIPYSIVMRMILGGGRVELSAGIGLVSLASSALIYWFMINKAGVLGAAWASVMVYAVISASCIFVHLKQEKVA